MKKGTSKKNTVIGLTAAIATIVLWTQRDAASAAAQAQGAAVAAVADAAGSGMAAPPASLAVAYTEITLGGCGR